MKYLLQKNLRADTSIILVNATPFFHCQRNSIHHYTCSFVNIAFHSLQAQAFYSWMRLAPLPTVFRQGLFRRVPDVVHLILRSPTALSLTYLMNVFSCFCRFAFGLTVLAHRALLSPAHALRYDAVVKEFRDGYVFARNPDYDWTDFHHAMLNCRLHLTLRFLLGSTPRFP